VLHHALLSSHPPFSWRPPHTRHQLLSPFCHFFKVPFPHASLEKTMPVVNFLSHVKISRGFVKNHLKITSEKKEWQKIILKS
jgi:hypothetical protein